MPEKEIDLETQLLVEEVNSEAFAFMCGKLGIAQARIDRTGEAIACWVIKKNDEYLTISSKQVNSNRAVVNLLHSIGELASRGFLENITILPVEEAEEFIQGQIDKNKNKPE